jgi:hypothetical protein
MTGRFLLLVVFLFGLAGCAIPDGIAHLVKLWEQPSAEAPASPPPAAAPAPEAPAPAAAPRNAVTTEELPPPKK